MLPDGRISTRAVVRGYCKAHRDQVREVWVGELEDGGTFEWIGEPPTDLRAREVEDFPTFTDEFGGERSRTEAGHATCPHCASWVRFGIGPHTDDAALRTGAAAWECPGCGAAGFAYLEH